MQNGFFLSLGFYSSVDASIFFCFHFFLCFLFNISLIHKEKHAFFQLFHNVFLYFFRFVYFLLLVGYQGERKGKIFLYNLSMVGFLFSNIFFCSILIFIFTCLLFWWFKMNLIVHLIWASGSFFSSAQFLVSGQENGEIKKF